MILKQAVYLAVLFLSCFHQTYSLAIRHNHHGGPYSDYDGASSAAAAAQAGRNQTQVATVMLLTTVTVAETVMMPTTITVATTVTDVQTQMQTQTITITAAAPCTATSAAVAPGSLSGAANSTKLIGFSSTTLVVVETPSGSVFFVIPSPVYSTVTAAGPLTTPSTATSVSQLPSMPLASPTPATSTSVPSSAKGPAAPAVISTPFSQATTKPSITPSQTAVTFGIADAMTTDCV